MASEEYYKARYTGVADMSKAGAADGLIARQRDMAPAPKPLKPMAEAEKRRAIRQGEAFGAGVVNGLAWAFPVWSLLVADAAALRALFEIGVAAGLGATAASLPDWYLAAGVVLPAVLVILLRRPVRAAMRLALHVLLGAFLGLLGVGAAAIVAMVAKAMLT